MMVKNVVLFIASVLLIPLTMFADQQLELLKKQAQASFNYWPYILFYTLAPLVFAFVALGLFRMFALKPHQKVSIGAIYLFLGLFVILYPMMDLMIPNFLNIPGLWYSYRELVRIVGSLFAVTGLFQVRDGQKEKRVTHE